MSQYPLFGYFLHVILITEKSSWTVTYTHQFCTLLYVCVRVIHAQPIIYGFLKNIFFFFRLFCFFHTPCKNIPWTLNDHYILKVVNIHVYRFQTQTIQFYLHLIHVQNSTTDTLVFFWEEHLQKS